MKYQCDLHPAMTTRFQSNNTISKVHSSCQVDDLIDEKPNESNLTHLFRKFCSSSTIHGTYFWSESRSPVAKTLWGLIVLFGIVSATFIINSSFEGWKDNPVITSVMQKSIEEIPFPAITICPLDDTRFYLLVIFMSLWY